MTTTARERTLTNITFHGVGPQPRVIEAGEDRVWVSSTRFAEILDTLAQYDDVAIMFDDGNASDVREALPALLDRGLQATFFVGCRPPRHPSLRSARTTSASSPTAA